MGGGEGWRLPTAPFLYGLDKVYVFTSADGYWNVMNEKWVFVVNSFLLFALTIPNAI